jgi:hypothetical protein
MPYRVIQEYGPSLLRFLTLYRYAVAETGGQLATEIKMTSIYTRWTEHKKKLMKFFREALSFLLC